MSTRPTRTNQAKNRPPLQHQPKNTATKKLKITCHRIRRRMSAAAVAAVAAMRSQPAKPVLRTVLAPFRPNISLCSRVFQPAKQIK